MRRLALLGPNQVDWEEVDDAVVEEPDDAVVRPLAVAACDIDRPLLFGAIPVLPPVGLGHEFVGEVVEVGPDVTGFAGGDRVAVPFAISCGTCDRCRRGLTTNCTSVPRGSMFGLGSLGRDWPGVAADLVRVPFASHMLMPFPEGLDPTVAGSISDNLPDGWRTVAPGLERWPGADVLIVAGGAPSIGLYAVMFAKALGAGTVTYLDRDAGRLAAAEAFGAQVEDITAGYPRKAGEHPVTVDASAQPEGLACAMRSTASAGLCTSVGIYFGPETPVPLFDMYLANSTFTTGRPHARMLIPTILEALAAGRFDPSPIQTVVPWEDAQAAWSELPTKLVLDRRQVV